MWTLGQNNIRTFDSELVERTSDRNSPSIRRRFPPELIRFLVAFEFRPEKKTKTIGTDNEFQKDEFAFTELKCK